MGLDPATGYGQFRDALLNNSSHRPMLFNICNPLVPEFHGVPYDRSAYVSYTFGPTTGNAWRTYSDIGFSHSIQWPDVLRNYDKNALHPEAAGPGHWNDPDYLGPELGMTAAEAQAQLSLWAVAAAPLIIGSDVRSLNQQTIDMLTNRDALAIDQDPMGVQGTRISQQGQGDVWVKPLANGDRAVALLNRGATPITISTTAAAIGLPRAASYSLQDVWSGTRTEAAATIARTVPPDSAALLRVAPGTPAGTAPDTVLSAPNVPATPGSDRLLVMPDTVMPVTATFQNDGREPAIDAHVTLTAPDQWTISGAPPAQAIPPDSSITGNWQVKPPAGALPGTYQLTVTANYRWGGADADARTSQVTVQVPSTPPSGTEYLSNHGWIEGTSGWMVPRLNHEVGGGPLRMLGQAYAHGIGTASVSRIEYYLRSNCTSFNATIGIDDAVNFDPTGATAVFQLYGDGQKLYDSGTVDRHATKSVNVSLTGVNVLALVVGDAGDGTYNDRADWADPQLSCSGPPATAPDGPWPHYVPNTTETATASSANNGYPASNAIDGDLTTLWHSEFSPVHTPLPISLTIDLGSATPIYGLTYQPRLDGTPTGTITSYEVEVSTDGGTFTPITSGSWPDDSSLKSTSFQATTARFVRLVADTGDGGYASAAEVQAAREG
jgi:alpha-galactosidase